MTSRGSLIASLALLILTVGGCSMIPSILSTPLSPPPAVNLMAPVRDLPALPPVETRTSEDTERALATCSALYLDAGVRLIGLQSYARRVSGEK